LEAAQGGSLLMQVVGTEQRTAKTVPATDARGESAWKTRGETMEK